MNENQLSEVEIEKLFSRYKDLMRVSWIIDIHKELLARGFSPELVTLENHQHFIGLKPHQAADRAINLFAVYGILPSVEPLVRL